LVLRNLRIAIATAGRFHVLDLARELHAFGHDVRFYSYLPGRRAEKFGLPKECHVSLLPFVAPMLAWGHLFAGLAPRARERMFNIALNRAVMMRLKPCDVFICMSGIYLEAAQEAKRSYGARIWLERGSRHILSQDEILSAIPGAERPSPLAIRRELEGYALADRIVIPSTQVEDSFRHDEAARTKLFRNPYGVDLQMFPRLPSRPRGAPFTFLFVGSWSLRKGCDLLSAAIKQTPGVCLLHVGGMGDLEFPHDDSRFSHFDAKPQWELAEFYGRADAFVHASREEGLSTVIAQALAIGLPIICTDRTGGADLSHTPALAERITVVPHNDAAALSGAMAQHRDRTCGWPSLTDADRETLSWAAYARRYNDELLRDPSET
jgi:glycosyltransferase involved in cell wall biosynthesis